MKYRIEDVQKTILIAAKEVKRICDVNDINYSLEGGSLLGAVRHGGFIPWDDDIDFAMTRKNYEKFIKCCEKQLNERFEILNWHTDKYYGNGFLKILIKDTIAIEEGTETAKYPHKLFVDVFPFDSIPDSKRKQFIQRVISRSCIRILQQKDGSGFKTIGLKTPIYLLFRFISKILSHDFLVGVAEKALNRYNKMNTKFLTSITGVYEYNREMIEQDIFNDFIELEFEGIPFKAIKNYDKFLTQVFGDYMKIPSPEDRKNHEFISVDFGKTRIV